jgi:hypothetical protein
MAVTLSERHIRLLRLKAQGLGCRHAKVPEDVVRHSVAIQAQELRAARLGIRVRSDGLTDDGIERERVEGRSIVRTWCLRGTLQLVSANDIGWLLPLFGPVFIAKAARRFAQLGLVQKTAARGTAILSEVLAHEAPLTRDEAMARMEARSGTRLTGQARYHILRHAALTGVLCLGPDRDNEPTYIPLGLPANAAPVPSLAAAARRLVDRYMNAYAPAQFEDIVAWSGLPVATLRPAWESAAPGFVWATAGKTTYALLKSQLVPLEDLEQPRPIVRLLPSFDGYLLGYRRRNLIAAPKAARSIQPGGGIMRPVLLVDGCAAGTWHLQLRGGNAQIEVSPFRQPNAAVRGGIADELDRLGCFLGAKAKSRIRTAPD